MKNRLLTWWSIAIMVLVGLSRIYLGVHWPQDVLVGLTLGIAFAYLFALFDQWWVGRHISFAINLAVAIALPPVLLVFDRSSDAVKIVGFLMGMAPGYLIEERWVGFKEQCSPILQISKLMLGLVVLLAIKAGVKPILPVSVLSDVFRYALIGIAATLGLPTLFRRLHWG